MPSSCIASEERTNLRTPKSWSKLVLGRLGALMEMSQTPEFQYFNYRIEQRGNVITYSQIERQGYYIQINIEAEFIVYI